MMGLGCGKLVLLRAIFAGGWAGAGGMGSGGT